MTMPTSTNITLEAVLRLLDQVPDPEIPVLSVLDLGIVREVRMDADGGWVVAITPTYSGCPAMAVIADGVRQVLAAHGVAPVRIETRLAPAWTTDWMSAAARAKLRDYGVAPPTGRVGGYQKIDIGALLPGGGDLRDCGETLGENRGEKRGETRVACPRCASQHTRLVSRFGSTGCKALYVCQDCREPFDYFKPH